MQKCRHLVYPCRHIHGTSTMHCHNGTRVDFDKSLNKRILSIRQFKRPISPFKLQAGIQSSTEDHTICLPCQVQGFRIINCMRIIPTHPYLGWVTVAIPISEAHCMLSSFSRRNLYPLVGKRLTMPLVYDSAAINIQPITSLCINKNKNRIGAFWCDDSFPLYLIGST